MSDNTTPNADSYAEMLAAVRAFHDKHDFRNAHMVNGRIRVSEFRDG